MLAYKDGLNNFYVAKEHPELLTAFSVPPNLFDNYTLATTESLSINLQGHKEQVQTLTTLVNNIEAESLDRFNQIQSLKAIIDKLQKS